MGFLSKFIDFGTLRSKTFWSLLAYRVIVLMGERGVISGAIEESALWIVGTVLGVSVVDRSTKIINAAGGGPKVISG